MALVLQGPDYRNRRRDQIIRSDVFFDSVGYTYRSLSWIDIAKRDRCVCALQTRLTMLVMHLNNFHSRKCFQVGRQLDRENTRSVNGYQKTDQHHSQTKPQYQKLASFTKRNFYRSRTTAHRYLGPQRNYEAMGKVSNYLHWTGEPAETVESPEWLNEGIVAFETALNTSGR